MGTLYLVATPIGNLEDISLRALRVLRQVELVAAEDTRVTRKLLTHHGIRADMISYFEHNKIARLNEILSALTEADVALVSDAGTPGLNDPGYELVRAAVDAGHAVSPIPGPSAPIAALAASGLPTDSFLYLGYLPRRQSERRAALERVASHTCTLVFLEAPHRLGDTLADLLLILGDREIAVARELTKLHEEIWRGGLSEASKHFSQPRGEFVLVVHGAQPAQPRPWSDAELRAAVHKRLAGGEPPTVVAVELAAQSGRTRRDIYKLAVAAKSAL